ncbi:MAG: S1C family serine protease [Treponema sp.]|jgi:S1-C subfamily serine protease|nr:S1C family serine protease [Treponema sp.]
MGKNYFNKYFILILLVILLAFSCRGISRRVNPDDFPSHTTSSTRLEEISKQIEENPVNAIALIYIYKEIYSVTDNINDNEDWKLLFQYEEEAKKNLVAAQAKAIQEERWEDAVSFGRSISVLGIVTPYSGREADLILSDAKKKLQDGNNLAAFLAAVRAHETQPLDAQSAVLFLEKAVEARQRRTAAFFLAAAERAGARNISANLREYANGRDTASDMIKGAATVLVDRGYKIEKGMGFADRMLGSAFFIDSSGLLITNYHVIASEVDPKYKGYSRLFILMGDASSPRIPARVIGWDKALDLALIKTEIQTEYVFSIVDRVVPRVGDSVLAIGSPLGLEKTVSSGIVSALGRRFLQIGDVIQIDAGISQGNSGGPVVDNQGRLVGVAFAGVAYHQGLNFIIPAEMLAAALPAMLKGGRAPRPWLGFTLCETFSGAEIIYTTPNTPGSMNGVRDGSFIRTINGKTITAQQGNLIPALQKTLFYAGPGELIALETIEKDDVVKKRIIMTAARPDLPMLEAVRLDKREKITAPLFGMMLTPLQSTLFSNNFRVDRVVRGSISDAAGISENDPITLNRLRLLEDEGVALLEISVKKRRMGFLETNMQLPARLDTPDTL